MHIWRNESTASADASLKLYDMKLYLQSYLSLALQVRLHVALDLYIVQNVGNDRP